MKKMHSKLLGLIFITLTMLVLACSFGGTASLPAEEIFLSTAPAVAQPTLQLPAPAIISDEDQVLMDIYKRINPAVVNVITYYIQDSAISDSGQGSGFIYDSNGHIITNAHVVHGADQIEVVFADSSMRRASIIGEDLHSDLAVIQVESLPGGIQPIPLGDIREVAVGQTVVAIGNPFGLGGTLTRGIVSALGRTIPALTVFSIPQAIQTDAPINPGNSGGPLLNLEGEVIGVNAQIETGGSSRANSGVGFAIPVSIVEKVIPILIETGEYKWAWLGVRGGSLNPTLVDAMNLLEDRGAYMAEIIPGGPADNAGLQGAYREDTVDGHQLAIGGDVVVAIDGQPIYSFDDLLIYITLSANPDQEITITILREGEYQEVIVRLEERPKSDTQFPLPQAP